MTCPNKKCASQIPDDCLYCDQCGKLIMKCPKCGVLGTSKFCTTDGSPMQPRALEPLSTAVPPLSTSGTPPGQAVPAAPPAGAAAPDSGATVRSPSPFKSSVLQLLHAGGLQLACPSESILGRKAGPHAAYLAAYGYISGQHGKVILKGGTWIYVDMGSTNGTRLNGSACVAQTEYPIKAKDILELGDQKFQVQ
ncbi:MAG: FHA domain-containing protein [Rectinemataceae bacterium]